MAELEPSPKGNMEKIIGDYRFRINDELAGFDASVFKQNDFLIYASLNHMTQGWEFMWSPHPEILKDDLTKILLEDTLSLVSYLKRIWKEIKSPTTKMYPFEDEEDPFTCNLIDVQETLNVLLEHPLYSKFGCLKTLLYGTQIQMANYGGEWNNEDGVIQVFTDIPQTKWLLNFFERTSKFKKEELHLLSSYRKELPLFGE